MKKRRSKKIASFFCYFTHIHRSIWSEHATPPGSIFKISWPRRGHMSLAIWSLAAQNISLYPLVPGGTNVFIVPLCALRPKMLETCDPEGVRCGILGKFVPPAAWWASGIGFFCFLTPEGSHVSCYLVPGGTKCFIVSFGPLRQKFLNNKCVNGLCRELGNLSVL